jgi:hypothetical protein
LYAKIRRTFFLQSRIERGHGELDNFSYLPEKSARDGFGANRALAV